jgi:hypothetical protein
MSCGRRSDRCQWSLLVSAGGSQALMVDSKAMLGAEVRMALYCEFAVVGICMPTLRYMFRYALFRAVGCCVRCSGLISTPHTDHSRRGLVPEPTASTHGMTCLVLVRAAAHLGACSCWRQFLIKHFSLLCSCLSHIFVVRCLLIRSWQKARIYSSCHASAQHLVHHT